MKTTTPIEVRYQETDQMGVVYHANYLVWFEIGRTKFIESLGFCYADMEKDGVVSPVTNAQISFKKPIRYGEKVLIETWLDHYDGLRTVYGYHILNEVDEIAVSGKTEHVIVKKENFRPLSVRKAFPDWHEAYMSALEKTGDV
ncbi:acyl-CoA thioester hydrolase [Cerasibacillus quisquiliarum]|uniref:Putative acyl-CoA thioesterase YneP n=1 Tax=Cerasibacillus quisquiliarum TaxID=227865 RepID=A0A511UV96_9BACI|nr:thioesterase family protein [Cerasibacillus quisquiliarum]MBB5145960.1 acyl-CoA thioester hydrolase [Cerasibacillus quisquiliarum]GEN30530.1 putative acyl-CoA thioesterase YneP [Cerasibacillus quisquiliarum]